MGTMGSSGAKLTDTPSFFVPDIHSTKNQTYRHISNLSSFIGCPPSELPVTNNYWSRSASVVTIPATAAILPRNPSQYE